MGCGGSRQVAVDDPTAPRASTGAGPGKPAALAKAASRGLSALSAHFQQQHKPLAEAWAPSLSDAAAFDWLRAVHAGVDAVWAPLVASLEARIGAPGARGPTWEDVSAADMAALLQAEAGDDAPKVKAASEGLLRLASALWARQRERSARADAGAPAAEAAFVSEPLCRLLGAAAIALCHTVGVEDAEVLSRRAQSWERLCADFGLGRPELCALLDGRSKALLLYLDVVREGDGMLKLQVARETVLWDALPQWEASAYGSSQRGAAKLFPKFRDVGGGYEAGEGHGPRKEAFGLIGHQMLHGEQPLQPEAERLLRFGGWLLAQALCNRSTLQVALPPLVFRRLLLGQGSRPTPTLELLREFDPSAHANLKPISSMKAADFAAMCELDGLPASASRQEYLDAACARLLYENVSWQLDALAEGFQRVLTPSALEGVGMSAHQLLHALCGVGGTDGAEEAFSIRQVFRIVEDETLRECAPLSDALWHVLEGWSPSEKRSFVKFVTGSARLPAAGSEVISIQMPFDDIDPNRVLGTLPQAHTCDNVLELPDYWQALLSRSKASGGAMSPSEHKLAPELHEIINARFRLAVFECDAYGLDEMGGGGGGGGGGRAGAGGGGARGACAENGWSHGGGGAAAADQPRRPSCSGMVPNLLDVDHLIASIQSNPDTARSGAMPPRGAAGACGGGRDPNGRRTSADIDDVADLIQELDTISDEAPSAAERRQAARSHEAGQRAAEAASSAVRVPAAAPMRVVHAPTPAPALPPPALDDDDFLATAEAELFGGKGGGGEFDDLDFETLEL